MLINIAGGTGVMGKLHKKIFEEAGHKVILSGRTSKISLEDAAKKSDLTIVSVPIPSTEEVIKKVAPHCSAIMDFTGLKQFPLKAMEKYAPMNCEIAGLHPLYGKVNSIRGRTIIYCKTKRTGKKCEEIVDSLKKSGAKIKNLTPQQHDLWVNAIAQNARSKLLESYGLLLDEYGIKIEDLYEISPPPTKMLLDLLARQMDANNDGLYESMRKYNPITEDVNKNIIKYLSRDNIGVSGRLRKSYGKFLRSSQKRMKKIINLKNT